MCSMIVPSANSQSNCKKRGFALVLALALLSLVFLLVISLVNLVSTDLSLVESRKEKILAQAHARMGMKIAMGEIQKHLGPDMRISATADLLDERIESGKNYEDSAYSRNSNPNYGIDLNEDGRIDPLPYGQRYWTGVWKHRGRDRGVAGNKLGAKPLPENIDTGDSLSEKPMVSTEFDPHPAIEVSWLVSGNEGFDKKLYFGLNPLDLKEFVEIPDGNIWDTGQADNGRSFVKGGIYGEAENAWEDYSMALQNSSLRGSGLLPEYNHPLFELPDPLVSDEVEWLLVSPLLKQDFDINNFDLNDPATWENSLSSEPVKVRKTRVQHQIEGNDEAKYGSYAYWVGDEGVKAKVNIQNPNKQSDDSQVIKDNRTVSVEPNIYFSSSSSSSSNDIKSGFGVSFKDMALIERKKDILSLGRLSELSDADSGISAHYHSLTTDSFGVLSDVRTGGLKRDLSSAFANEDEWYDPEFLRFNTDDWSDDFSNYLFKHRIFYQKSVPYIGERYPGNDNQMGTADDIIITKENDWRQGSDQTLLEEHAILAGPRWSLLGSFHNYYLLKKYGSIPYDGEHETDRLLIGLFPDDFPRMTGDNTVLFNHLAAFSLKPNSPGNNPAITKATNLRQNFNSFLGLEKRPEPKNHPIQPVLVEIKYAHHPYFDTTSNELGLATYPSVALWNPYDVGIGCREYYIEIPIQIGMEAMNAKHYDLYRKWWMYCFDNQNYLLNDGNDPSVPPFNIPKGFKNFEDRNGNGKRDAGEPWIGTQGFGNSYDPRQPRDAEYFFRYYDWGTEHAFPRSTLKISTSYSGFLGTNLGLGNRINERRFLFSNDVEKLKENWPRQDRHLLLRLSNFRLQPGEKAHFTVKSRKIVPYDKKWENEDGYSNQKSTTYVEVELGKLKSGNEEEPLIFLCGDSSIQPTDPVSIRYFVWGYRGVHPNEKESFTSKGMRTPVSGLDRPKGITIYSEDPTNVAYQNQKIIGKISKQFAIEIGSGITDYARCDDLSFLSVDQDFIPGCGFRIRYKLPGESANVVFEQFNLRGLIHSNQDGFGDNWELETFRSTYADGHRPASFMTPDKEKLFDASLTYPQRNSNNDRNVSQPPHQPTLADVFFQLPHTYPRFFNMPASIDDNVTGVVDNSSFIIPPPNSADTPSGFNSDYGKVPRARASTSRIGFFHEEDYFGKINSSSRAVMFEVPSSPMLSLFQFRHANLNNYSHGPTYALGNSYASTQVARYYTWGKMKAFSMQPVFGGAGMDIKGNIQKAKELMQAGLSYNPFVWEPYRDADEDAYIRDRFIQNDHQNITLDHSFYLNYALLDGYFMSGLGIGSEWKEADPKEFSPGDRYLPYRNSRLIPYLREAEWKTTSYSDKDKDAATSDNDFRYQTLSSDLLVDGAFNVNSTSVDAWASQLTSMKKEMLESRLVSDNINLKEDETPVFRFTDYSNREPNPPVIPFENPSWNTLRKLKDEEINLLAHKIVEQVKLRGPFLSYADFVNRRIQGNKFNLLELPFTKWNDGDRKETRSSVLGLRGAIQAGIAQAKLNQGGFEDAPSDSLIPVIPSERFTTNNPPLIKASAWPLASDLYFKSSDFGIHAISSTPISFWDKTNADKNDDGKIKISDIVLSYPPIVRESPDWSNAQLDNPQHILVYPQKWGRGKYNVNYFNPPGGIKGITMPNGLSWKFEYNFDNFEDTFYYGDTPENLLAVENVATAANKPGWVMQSDLLSPLAPVTSVRSDTFVVRVMGESLQKENEQTQAKAWIELTVQRVPDYVKSDLDNPHHRPHEPFEDRNFNGYWDADLPGSPEHWIDLNQNSVTRKPNGSTEQVGSELYPNLASDSLNFADGLESDLSIQQDPDEEQVSNMNATVSHKGINQRFGRRFKIIKFRWLKAQDV